MKRITIDDPAAKTEAVAALKAGQLVVFPTETCYGLAADPTNPLAVNALLEFKGARGRKAISIAVASEQMTSEYVEINDIARNLYHTLLPGPVTVVSASKGMVDARVEHERKTVGVRIPDFPWVLELVALFNKPITATSANQSGRKPPYSYDDFVRYTSESKRKMVAIFIDAGILPHRPPSTIVDTTLNEVSVLRQGEVILDETERRISHSEAETRDIGAEEMYTFTDLLESKPLIVALQGDLGAGKTQFVKGMAHTLRIEATVNSPTYTIMHEFPYELNKVSGTLYHIDTWRLHDVQELVDLGFQKLLRPGNVIAIEWSEKMTEMLKQLEVTWPIWWVAIEVTADDQRLIRWRYARV